MTRICFFNSATVGQGIPALRILQQSLEEKFSPRVVYGHFAYVLFAYVLSRFTHVSGHFAYVLLFDYSIFTFVETKLH